MLVTVRVQEKGQVTIPSAIRKKLRLKKGDLVVMITRENGVVIQPISLAVKEEFTSLERSLAQRGHKLEALLLAYQRVGERAALDFGLSEVEKSRLYIALQLQAQQALESIRVQSEKLGLDQLSEDEINAEVQVVRDEAAGSHRS